MDSATRFLWMPGCTDVASHFSRRQKRGKGEEGLARVQSRVRDTFPKDEGTGAWAELGCAPAVGLSPGSLLSVSNCKLFQPQYGHFVKGEPGQPFPAAVLQ